MAIDTLLVYVGVYANLDAGQAGLVVVAVSDMGAKVERAMERAAKLEQKQLEADVDEIERDAASVEAGSPELQIVDALPETERGAAGWGSSGR